MFDKKRASLALFFADAEDVRKRMGAPGLDVNVLRALAETYRRAAVNRAILEMATGATR